MPDKTFLNLLIIFGICISCNTTYQPQKIQYKDYKITRSAPASVSLVALLQPFADSVNKSMNDVIGVAGITLEKKQPEGLLGNFIADAMLAKAREKYPQPVDFAVMNSGGIRLTTIPAGNITRGKIFELSPFDNVIVILKITGLQLQAFLDHIADRMERDRAADKGAWPVAGMSFQIKNYKAVNVKIGGISMDDTITYSMATLDYVANGGDDASMLRKIAQINRGYIFRDAILEYISGITKSGKKISGYLENRVSYAD